MVLAQPQKRRLCPECSSERRAHDYETGEDICMDCGLVIEQEQLVNTAPRQFDNHPDRRQTGDAATVFLHDRGYMTEISAENKDRYGKRLTGEKGHELYRLRKWQQRSKLKDAHERNLAAALPLISLFCDKLSLSKPVHARAAVIYRKAVDMHLVKGRSINELAAASVYFACRNMQVVRTLKEITDATEVAKKPLTRDYRLLLNNLAEQNRLPVSKPAAHITRIGEALKISGDLQGQAIRLLQLLKDAPEVSKAYTLGKDPRSLAAAALYIVCTAHKTGVTQKDLAEAFKITEVTVRNRYKELLPQLYILANIPSDATLKVNAIYTDDQEAFQNIKAYLTRKERTLEAA